MNCPNCGAPMKRLETRPCWQCHHCSSMVCEETALTSGLRLVERDAGEVRSCPVCRVPLVSAIMDGADRLELCPQCKGILMPRRTFAVTITAKRRAAVTPGVIPSPTDAKDLDRRISCPVCGGGMTTDWYYGPGNIVLDTCPACDVAWLDGGELERVVDAPGSDRPA